MIDLLATAPEDGWAFVRRNGKIQLVRPPYQRWSLVDVDESVVERAVKDHGFTAQEENVSFSGWDQLIAHLKRQIVATRRAQGRHRPQTAAIRGLIHKAPRKVLSQYLEKVESELLPDYEWQSALDLLTEMLTVEVVKEDEKLYQKTVELLRRAQGAASAEEARKYGLIDEEARFKEIYPRSAEVHGVPEVVAQIRAVIQQGQIYAPAPTG